MKRYTLHTTQRNKPAGMKVFFLIWLGQLVSITGSGLTSFALGVWVYQTTGLATPYTLILFFLALPNVLSSLLAGPLDDQAGDGAGPPRCGALGQQAEVLAGGTPRRYYEVAVS